MKIIPLTTLTVIAFWLTACTTTASSNSPIRVSDAQTAEVQSANNQQAKMKNVSQARKVATDATPIARFAPRYPASAARGGIEGWVSMSFDISPTGKTINIKVIDSVPDGVFDHQAQQALSKWIYKPRIVNGEAVIQSGLEVRLDFNLGK